MKKQLYAFLLCIGSISSGMDLKPCKQKAKTLHPVFSYKSEKGVFNPLPVKNLQKLIQADSHIGSYMDQYQGSNKSYFVEQKKLTVYDLARTTKPDEKKTLAKRLGVINTMLDHMEKSGYSNKKDCYITCSPMNANVENSTFNSTTNAERTIQRGHDIVTQHRNTNHSPSSDARSVKLSSDKKGRYLVIKGKRHYVFEGVQVQVGNNYWVLIGKKLIRVDIGEAILDKNDNCHICDLNGKLHKLVEGKNNWVAWSNNDIYVLHERKLFCLSVNDTITLHQQVFINKNGALCPLISDESRQQSELQKQVRINCGSEAIAYFNDKEFPLYKELIPFYREHGFNSMAQKYEKRLQAYQEILNKLPHERYATQSYDVSVTAKELITRSGYQDLYAQCYGNALQQVVHQECIDLVEKIAILPEQSPLYMHKEALLECTHAACEYNQLGLTHKATVIVDFFWTLLDCGKAVIEGAYDGIVSAVTDMIEHPVQAIMTVVVGEYVFAYQLSKILYEVGRLGITTYFDPKKGAQQWHEYIAPLQNLINAIAQQQLSVQDTIKGAVHFAVEWKAQEKLLSGLNKLYSTVKNRAIAYAEKYPSVAPEQYLQTSEGILVQSTHTIDHPDVLKDNLLQKMSSEQGVNKNTKQKINEKISQTINQASEAILRDGYYEVNGFRFTEYYYNKLWNEGRKAPSLIVQSILDHTKAVMPDPKGYVGFYKYVSDGWYMIYNPATKIVSHLEPIHKLKE